MIDMYICYVLTVSLNLHDLVLFFQNFISLIELWEVEFARLCACTSWFASDNYRINCFS